MIKGKFLKRGALLGALILLLGIGSISVSASNKSSSPKEVLKQYFLAYQSKNIDLTADLSNDTRCESENEEKVFLKEIFQDTEQDLRDFEVLEVISEDNKSAIVKGRASLGNGEIFERAFKLSKINNNWVVILSDTIPCKEEFKQIKNPDKEDGGLKQFEGEKIENYNSEAL